MFRKMRRINQQLSNEEAIAVLERGMSGVLAVSGDDGYPYAVPLSYSYHDGKLFFHCAKTGHKLDAIAGDDRVSFCVVDKDEVVSEKYTTYFRSVIAFGRARIIEDKAEKRKALEVLAAKYSPEQVEGRALEIEKKFELLNIIELSIEHMTGKEAIELIKRKQQGANEG